MGRVLLGGKIQDTNKRKHPTTCATSPASRMLSCFLMERQFIGGSLSHIMRPFFFGKIQHIRINKYLSDGCMFLMNCVFCTSSISYACWTCVWHASIFHMECLPLTITVLCSRQILCSSLLWCCQRTVFLQC